MDSFVAMLKDFGPFSTPLCIAMGWALQWLVKDRARLVEELKIAHDDSKAIRDKRTEDQRAAAAELREFADAITHRLEEWSKRSSKSLPPPSKE
jgi:hypothetical protein